MARTAVLALTLALVATGASAQTTTCGDEWGKWVCRTSPDRSPASIGQYQFGNPMDSFNRARESSARSMPTPLPPPAQNYRAPSEDIRAAQDAERERDVAALLREGRCDDAKARALIGDDIDLADKVARICTPSAR